MSSQKNIFLRSEANNFFLRNKIRLSNVNYKTDEITAEVEKIINPKIKIKILEIGCCDAGMINYLNINYKNVKCYGVDPSDLALKSQKNNSLVLKRGTADNLSFGKNEFDILIFNFCLYLCDTEDLIKIVAEADRVLKKNSYLLIYDFYYKGLKYIKYKHKKNIYSRKMDFSKLFIWHPNYKLIKIKKFMHKPKNINFKNNKLNQTAVYTLKKE